MEKMTHIITVQIAVAGKQKAEELAEFLGSCDLIEDHLGLSKEDGYSYFTRANNVKLTARPLLSEEKILLIESNIPCE